MPHNNQLFSQGLQNFTEGIRQFSQNLAEVDFLEGTVSTMVKQREALGIPTDPSVLAKFAEGNLATKRGIASQLGTEMSMRAQMAQLDEARQKSLGRFEDRMRGQMDNAALAAFTEGINRGESVPQAAARASQVGVSIPGIGLVGPDAQTVIGAANAFKGDTLDAMSKRVNRISELEQQAQQARESGNEKEAQRLEVEAKRLEATIGSGGFELTRLPDGTIKVVHGRTGQTTSTKAKAEQEVASAQKAIDMIGGLRERLTEGNLGVSGILDELSEKIAPQLGVRVNTDATSERARIRSTFVQMLESLTGETARFTDRDIERARELFPSTGPLESQATAAAKLDELEDIIRTGMVRAKLVQGVIPTENPEQFSDEEVIAAIKANIGPQGQRWNVRNEQDLEDLKAAWAEWARQNNRL